MTTFNRLLPSKFSSIQCVLLSFVVLTLLLIQGCTAISISHKQYYGHHEKSIPQSVLKAIHQGGVTRKQVEFLLGPADTVKTKDGHDWFVYELKEQAIKRERILFLVDVNKDNSRHFLMSICYSAGDGSVQTVGAVTGLEFLEGHQSSGDSTL